MYDLGHHEFGFMQLIKSIKHMTLCDDGLGESVGRRPLWADHEVSMRQKGL